jgi:tungstate transport system substrate-binding protein
MVKRALSVAGWIAGILATAAPPAAAAAPAAAAPAEPAAPIILATTTSTQDSGLLDALMPRFEAESGMKVKVIAVGSGHALALGERGEADLVLAHAPSAEEKFMHKGAGVLRRRLMYNEYAIVGPPGDPAGLRREKEIGAALQALARSGAGFASRGDDSGTHQTERWLWALAGIDPRTVSGYLESGQGMGATLRVASEKRAYTLTDLGTYLAQKKGLDLEVLFEGDNTLRNVYHVLLVNPKNGPRVNSRGGEALARWFLSPEALSIVREFGREKFGRPLFTPDLEPYEAR